MSPNPLETADLVTFTEEILNGKRHFLHPLFLIYINDLRHGMTLIYEIFVDERFQSS